ncbi:hypothetical protein OZX58_04190 [Lactobacillus sp. ESL0680]|uniref:hypothetical protein n=1 Tax=Lactobacillus sp. ESL0680 TaxID=2983210 RepID=UPI0023F69D82|nr:hypothetical protein [Lactobacillus sp. ESL0680]WEV37955.1 hypothetical protein OZX58_04190 [Lactobacillus sp. ESL0680]
MKSPLDEKIQKQFGNEENKYPIVKKNHKTKTEKLTILVSLLLGLGIIIGAVYPLIQLLVR